MNRIRKLKVYYSALWIGALTILQATTAHANLQPDFISIVKENAPVVVNISTQKTTEVSSNVPPGFSMPNAPDDDPLKQFFKRFFPNQPGQDHERVLRSLGSGFIISEDGYILTNAHVVKGADEIVVRLSDQREKPAKLIGADQQSDVALIKIDAHGLPVAKLGDSSKLQVGQWVLAIGSPFGFDHSATQGIVSALKRNLPNENYVPFIQTDVAVNPGNSGGPLFDESGKVIGINSQIYSNSGGYMGLSFAIPIELAKNVAEQLKTKGVVTRGWLGVLIQPVNQELSDAFNLDRPKGALVSQVTPGSPADKGGIKSGDIITKFNGKPVGSSDQLPPLVANTKVGKPAEVTVVRDGKRKTLTVKIGQLDKANLASAKDNVLVDKLDITVANLSDKQRQKAETGNLGVKVETVGKGPAANAGIRPGDIILNVNHREVHNTRDMISISKGLDKNKPVPILVERGKNQLFLALKLNS
ncbi:MAG: DegQ family serine endoprotease [Gammaproteobacteria bacterium]|jgi:serine protease Do